MADSTYISSVDALRTRVSLLQRAKEDESQLAWEELLTFYEPFVSKVLVSLGFRGPDLQDAKQQVFVRLWKGLHTYERDPQRAKFRTWFARLIRNTAYNIHRAKKRQPQGPSFDDENSGQTNLLSDDAQIDERVELEWQEYVVELAMNRARTAFSGNAIEVFQMSLDGVAVETIASELNIKVNTVYILKHRVKAVLLREIQQLKTELETFDSPPAP